MRCRIRQQVMAQQGGAFGVAIQIPQHQPRPKASGPVVSLHPLIESVLALFSVNRADVDTQLSADPLNNDRVDHSLRGDVDGRHT